MMLAALAISLAVATVASATPAGSLQRRQDQFIAGQLYPESCMSDCQSWLDLQLPCTGEADQASCMCVRENTLALYACSACVVNAQGYDKTVADTMYSIVRVHDDTCDALSSSLNPAIPTTPLVVGGTTYLDIQPSDVTGGPQKFGRPTLYWLENGTTMQTNAGFWPSAFSTVTVSDPSTTTAASSTSSMSSAASQSSVSISSPSGTASLAGLSASESAAPSNGASSSGTRLPFIEGVTAAAVILSAALC